MEGRIYIQFTFPFVCVRFPHNLSLRVSEFLRRKQHFLVLYKDISPNSVIPYVLNSCWIDPLHMRLKDF